MVTAFLLAIAQLRDPRILRQIGKSVLLGLGCFAAAWVGIAFLLTHVHLTRIGWLETAIEVLGGLATLVLTWLLFPLVLTACVGLFLDGVAAAVEARHHPALPPAPGLPWWRSLAASLRFLAAVIVCNVLLLALLLVPPVYPVAYVLVNGALVGREYFEFVALRRLQPEAAHALQRRHRPALLLMGMVITVMLGVPLLNLITPVIATAAMVHRFEAWRGRGPSA
jgi:uncharacterized protein involved in cysteine biosynthesis